MSDVEFTGYPIELENRDSIIAGSIDLAFTMRDYQAPDEMDPRPYMRHDKQGNMGSCQGFSLANCCEYLWAIIFGSVSDDRQLSTLYCYLESQRVGPGNLFGLDRGSTIDSGIKVAYAGLLPESDLPYRTPYPANARSIVTDAMRTKAAAMKIRSHTWLDSYDAIFRYLSSGSGSVHTGTNWNNSFYASNGVLESVSLGRADGGHATAWLGYSRRKDSKGRNYIWRLNSHNDAWTELSPSVVDQLAKHPNSSIVGISDLATPEPRVPSWMKARPLG